MRALAAFEYHKPGNLSDALDILKQNIGKAKVYGGGTDILDLMKKRYKTTPEHLVNLKTISDSDPGAPNLHKISKHGQEYHFGPTVTLSDLAINGEFDILKDAAKKIATPQIRNAGTIGGNLCQEVRCWYYRWPEWTCLRKKGLSYGCFAPGGRNIYHAIMDYNPNYCHAVVPSDLAPCFAALDADIEIKSKDATGNITVKTEKVNKIYSYPYIQSDEIITDIIVPKAPAGKKGVFLKVSERNALDFAITSVAAARIPPNIRVAIGAVAPTIPIFTGTNNNDILNQVNTALQAATPLSENQYKIPIVTHLVKEALDRLP